MSDQLKGQIPELEDEQLKAMTVQYVHAVGHRTIEGKPVPLVGVLKEVLFDFSPEVMVKVDLSEAIDIVEASDLVFDKFEFLHGERVVTMPGPLTVKAARLMDIDPGTQTCLLAMSLVRSLNKPL